MSTGRADQPDALPRSAEPALPESTYRLQFHAGFTFRDATAIVPYLSELGVTHVYASPYLKARRGSTHGYDIVDHRVLNPEVGTPEEHDAFVAALRGHGLGLILDTVPNHMGVGTNENPWWNDVLENGPAARSADTFDIAWRAPARPELRDKVLLPVLGAPYGEALESGQLRLAFVGGAFVVRYFERCFPVAPRSYALILGCRVVELGARFTADDPEWTEYLSILTSIGHLPDRTETDRARVAERQREKEVVKRRLAELAARSATVRTFIDENVALFNGTAGDGRSFDRLDELLGHQCYRLSYWRVALEEINYRRFFDVNDLAALSVERPEVFAAVHETIFRWVAEGKVDGLRVDHPDGLYDPHEYFLRLQRGYLLARGLEASAADQMVESARAAPAPRRWPVYVVAEKILGTGEPLPDDWAVAGTTGYEFLNAINGLFVDAAAELAFTRLYRDLIESREPFAEVVYRSKRLILVASLAAELNTLTDQLDRLAQKRRASRDFTLNGLRAALRDVIACFPVYRSYISAAGPSAADREHVETAARSAAARNPLTNPALFRFIRDMLLLEYPPGATDEDRAEQERFAGKFQQVTSPVMAKGLEDTSFYIYNRLVSLNEVGGNPGRFGLSPEALHRFNADRRAKWPRGLAPLSTHDTKRSEDVRARINVLSEMPDDWGNAVRRWADLSAAHRTDRDGAPAPDANEEYLIYQTLIGAWPPGAETPGEEFTERITEYMVKALHEAKVHTSWVNPNADHDAAVQQFVRGVLSADSGRAFREHFGPFQKRVARYGAINTLSQTLLKFTAPGVADTYQGSELPDFSLVDPDNRRPVDYPHRRELLNSLRSAAAADPLALVRELGGEIESGRAKLYLTWRALAARRAHPGLFAEGEYLPLPARGAKAEHLFAFARRLNGITAVIAVPRLVARLDPGAERSPNRDVWGDTGVSLSELGSNLPWRDVFTNQTLTSTDGALGATELFAHFPVALLLSGE